MEKTVKAKYSRPIDRVQLNQMQAIFEAGFNKCAAALGKIPPYISQKEAHDTYGRRTVERWADEGLIEIIKDGTRNARCRILRSQIELVAAMSNRESWFEHHE